MIALRGVRRRFGDHVVLDGVDLDLPDDGVTALTGPNGSGKTTLARLLLGLGRPDGGRIDGLTGLRTAAVFQEDRLCPQLTAVENVRLVGRRGTTRAACAAELALVGLDEASREVPVRDLSGGQRRRVAIARALAVDAGLLVLDEPFTGLDAEGRAQVMAHVRERCGGRTTVLITHDPTDAVFFGARVVTLGTDGRLVTDARLTP